MHKKGLSTVVTSLIIILLVLVAIGIVWIVIRGVIEEGTGQIDAGTKCLEIDVEVIDVSNPCTIAASCNVTIKRNSGGDDIDGVKLVFKNNAGLSNDPIIDVPGNIEELATKLWLNGDPDVSLPIIVEVTPYIDDAGGNPHLCSTSSYQFG